MKQTLKEAVSEYIEKHVSRNENASFSAAFRAGAEWQANQSPWISVNERLPKIVTEDGETNYVLVRQNGRIPVIAKYCTEEYHVCPTFKLGHKIYRSHWITPTFNWLKFNVTHWMPIPTFDEILEANKDVLERIKEKGD